MLQEIYGEYEKKHTEYKEKCERLERLIEKHTESLKKLEMKRIGWYEGMVVPFAEAIAKRLEIPYKIYGPFGMCAKTTVYFFPGNGRDITKDETYSITIQPEGKELYYETGEKVNRYHRNTIGDMNGMNNVTAPLPDDMESIIALLRHAHTEK